MNYETNINGSPSDDGEDVKKELEDSIPGEGAPKKAGRRKINIEFIDDKSRRHITFSKRKAGIMKKAYELSTLTGTQVLLLVASETGHVYTFATPKLQPLITKPEGKNLIQSCLNAPEAVISPPSPPPSAHSAPSTSSRVPQPQYNEPPLMYPTTDPIYPVEHPPQPFEKDDSTSKEHRSSSSSSRAPQEAGGKSSGFHMDVAQSLGLAYGPPYASSSTTSSSLNMMGSSPHPLSMGSMNYGGASSLSSRYMSPQSSHTPPGVPASSTASTNPYTPSFPASVAGMMAQFPSPGFGPPTNPPSYLWGHTSSSSANTSGASQHGSESGNGKANGDSSNHQMHDDNAKDS